MEKSIEIQSCDLNAKSCCCSSETNSKKDFKSHWDDAYDNVVINKLGWYEESPTPSLRLIHDCKLNTNATLLNVGAGATTLVDELFDLGYNNIIANDISSRALDRLKERLGAQSEQIKWVVDDLTSPRALNTIGQVDLWHDRAVLHFFNEKEEQNAYFNLLKKMVKPEGFVIIATFNLNGATKCSGLPVYRYNEKMLAEKLGSDFGLIQAFNYNYTMPSGDSRAYVYTLYKRKNTKT